MICLHIQLQHKIEISFTEQFRIPIRLLLQEFAPIRPKKQASNFLGAKVFVFLLSLTQRKNNSGLNVMIRQKDLEEESQLCIEMYISIIL